MVLNYPLYGIYDWASRWHIPLEALEDLTQLFLGIKNISHEDTSEASLINKVRLEASEKNARLWRNNVGATYTVRGDFIRYGLANESAAQNAIIKSADLIGIRKILITQELVGRYVGQFVSREIKRSDWKSVQTEREKAQMAWAVFIESMGGDAKIVNAVGSL